MSEHIVVNASPLIVLARAQRMDLLRLLGSPIHVPHAVIQEVGAHSDEAASSCAQFDWLVPVPQSFPEPLIRSWDLGEGESAVLEWAHLNRPSHAILDDYAARRLANVLSIPVTGTLGLALLAKRRGFVAAARPVVDELCRAGLYLSPSVVEKALELVGESSDRQPAVTHPERVLPARERVCTPRF